MYAQGQGIPQNYQEAVKWFILAKASGARDADKALDMLTKDLTPSQLQKAQEDAQKWWDEHK